LQAGASRGEAACSGEGASRNGPIALDNDGWLDIVQANGMVDDRIAENP